MITVDIKPCITVDFGRLIRDILARGELTRTSLAMHASIPRSSVFNYENGVTPLHPVGERLIEIWCKSFGLGRDRVPVHAEPRPSMPSQPGRHYLEKLTVPG